jgi:hypothetical protein
VRLYGNVAVMTMKVHNAGALGGKPFDVMKPEIEAGFGKTGAGNAL